MAHVHLSLEMQTQMTAVAMPLRLWRLSLEDSENTGSKGRRRDKEGAGLGAVKSSYFNLKLVASFVVYCTSIYDTC